MSRLIELGTTVAVPEVEKTPEMVMEEGIQEKGHILADTPERVATREGIQEKDLTRDELPGREVVSLRERSSERV